jgi:hypothetical protein
MDSDFRYQFNDLNVLSGISDLRKQIDCTALSSLRDMQKQLDDSAALSGLREVQKQLDDSAALSSLREVQKQLDDSAALSSLREVQKHLDDSAALSGLNSLQKQFDSLTSVQRHLETDDILTGLNEARKHLVDSSLLNGFTPASSTLDDLNRLVREDRNRWDTINHSFNHLRDDEIELPTLPLKLPNIAEQFQRAIDARSDRDGEAQKQQFELLASIAEAGSGQNQTMAKIAELQETLVREALENTRIQKIVLYFAALTSVLALLGLLLK